MKPTFNYVLNDLALLNLADRCLDNWTSEQDKFDLRDQIVKLINENHKALKYNNKLLENRIKIDARNNRQKMENAKAQMVINKYKTSLKMQTRLSNIYKDELKKVHDRLQSHPEDFPRIIQDIEKVVGGKYEVLDD